MTGSESSESSETSKKPENSELPESAEPKASGNMADVASAASGVGAGASTATAAQSAFNGRMTVITRLFWLSILSLFLELLVIRWLSTEIRMFAYFKNLPLMAAFFGLGLGFMRTHSKRDWFSFSGLGSLFLCGLLSCALVLGLTFLNFTNSKEYMLFGLYSLPNDSPIGPVITLAVVLGVFCLTTSVFVGIGQEMGKCFAKLPPIKAYVINVTGALVGTILYSVCSLMGTDPGVWMVVSAVLFLIVQRRPANVALLIFGLVYSFWLGPYIASQYYGANYVETKWSPYYRVDVVKSSPDKSISTEGTYGYIVFINYDNFQNVIDCSPENLAKLPKKIAEHMDATFSGPYLLMSRTPERVLILGSGNGTDVAAALRNGAKHVDAVEIDPAILQIGREMHPEKPYSDPRVKAWLMDARSFIKNSKDKYDLIIFAYVDSHAAFSALSSLRMDNYLFTAEAFKEAAHLLKDDGVMTVSFLSLSDWLWDRHSKSIAAATGTMPLGYSRWSEYTEVGLIMAGPGQDSLKSGEAIYDMKSKEIDLSNPTPITNDDWPFLFLPRKELPLTYMLPILCVLSLSFLTVLREFRKGRSDVLNWQMLFLGMGFMLLEVRAMADLSLLFGSTWVVNSFVIGGVMIVILLGAGLASRLQGAVTRFVLVGVLLSLALTGFFNTGDLTRFGAVGGGLIGTGLFLFPLIFASTAFALLFKRSSDTPGALAYNLFGGLVGVCIEYISMWLGIRALSWIALLIYGAVLMLEILPGKKAEDGQE